MKQTQQSFNSTLRRSKKPIKQRPKTKDRNQQWKEICHYWIDWTILEYGWIICWWCGERGVADNPDDFNAVWGHHKDGNRNNCTSDNCYICHNRCQPEIHNNHIDVREYLNREVWLRSKGNGN